MYEKINCDKSSYRKKKIGFKTCVIVDEVIDTGVGPNEDRNY